MQHSNDRSTFRNIRYFRKRCGSDGFDSTFDIVSSLTGDIVARFPYWEQLAATECDADLLVQALNALVNRGGEIWSTELEAAMTTTDRVELKGLSTVPGSAWTIKQVLGLRPDLTLVEAYGVLHAVARYECEFPVDSHWVKKLADAAFPIDATTQPTNQTPTNCQERTLP